MGASSLRHFLAQTQRRVRQREMSAAQLHDYGRDGWLAPVCVQLLPSIFLSDERGGRQRTVVRCAATADNSKSPAQSHLPGHKRRLGKNR